MGSAMTKRHFEAIAMILATAIAKNHDNQVARIALVDVAYDFCNFCGTQNELFDPVRFADYLDDHVITERKKIEENERRYREESRT
ncbi:MAG: hypothetical protein CMB80_34680 [Flammeovirgaceae bacterium]|nr:hypothetical protein [Flammeovirgaceae bacterium]|tara:strand:- start:258 stop:515 length:258 start_codon:yes stop_codon:yes gene_type:complete